MSDTNEVYTMSEMYRLGMDCLVERFGIVNTEIFLAAVKTGNSDYTKWRRQVFDDMTPDEFDAAIKDFAASRKKDRVRRYYCRRSPDICHLPRDVGCEHDPICSYNVSVGQ